jgi:DNA-directed RNA polymerase subunit RPC12/RpoP
MARRASVRRRRGQNVRTRYKCIRCGVELYAWEFLWSMAADLSYQVPVCRRCALQQLQKEVARDGNAEEVSA